MSEVAKQLEAPLGQIYDYLCYEPGIWGEGYSALVPERVFRRLCKRLTALASLMQMSSDSERCKRWWREQQKKDLAICEPEPPIRAKIRTIQGVQRAQFLSRDQIWYKRPGWTMSLLEDVLGEPDAYGPRRTYLYKLDRVLAAEQTALLRHMRNERMLFPGVALTMRDDAKMRTAARHNSGKLSGLLSILNFAKIFNIPAPNAAFLFRGEPGRLAGDNATPTIPVSVCKRVRFRLHRLNRVIAQKKITRYPELRHWWRQEQRACR